MKEKEIQKENIKRVITYTITLAIMVFIFVQSAMPDYASAEESNFFVEIAKAIIDSVSTAAINPEILSHIIRKLAHFTEYTVFGASLVMTVKSLMRKSSFAEFDSVESNSRESVSYESVSDESTSVAKTSKTALEQQIAANRSINRYLFMTALLSWVCGTFYAITDEIHQYFVPGRFCDWKDVCIDSAGVALGCLICSLIVRKTAEGCERKECEQDGCKQDGCKQDGCKQDGF